MVSKDKRGYAGKSYRDPVTGKPKRKYLGKPPKIQDTSSKEIQNDFTTTLKGLEIEFKELIINKLKERVIENKELKKIVIDTMHCFINETSMVLDCQGGDYEMVDYYISAQIKYLQNWINTTDKSQPIDDIVRDIGRLDQLRYDLKIKEEKNKIEIY